MITAEKNDGGDDFFVCFNFTEPSTANVYVKSRAKKVNEGKRKAR